MDITITSSLSSNKTEHSSQTTPTTSKEDQYGFELLMQRLLETSYNLMGNSQYTAKLSVDQTKKKISTIIQFSSESEMS